MLHFIVTVGHGLWIIVLCVLGCFGVTCVFAFFYGDRDVPFTMQLIGAIGVIVGLAWIIGSRY